MDDRRKEAVTTRDALQALLSSPGWGILLAIADDQIKQLSNQIILTPLAGANTAELQEFNKGHVAGIRTFVALPGQLKEDAESILAATQPQTEDEEDAG